MKKSKSMRIGAVLLALTLITSCFVGATFAKYTTTLKAKDTVRVAKWDVKATDITPGTKFEAEAVTVDLFKAYSDANVDTDGAGTEVVIAPGTQGTFTFDLTNSSEVNAEYTIDYTVVEAGVPLKWTIDGTTWNEDLADVTEAVALNMNKTDVITVGWKWDFEGNDISDTALGVAGTAAPSVTISVTFTQVD